MLDAAKESVKSAEVPVYKDGVSFHLLAVFFIMSRFCVIFLRHLLDFIV